ncbi:MAG: hypothetical protein K8R59_05100 [Thermoanaerobaculales bacterium]|nr:hypothetical protein [Thermoanaerobaculales bacterium]
MFESLPDLLLQLEPHAILLALALPPVIRIVGHWIPEEVFMVSIGVLAARSGSLGGGMLLLAAVFLSHFVTDLTTYSIGCWLQPRVARFPKIASRLAVVTSRLGGSPRALLGLIPARVLPMGRGAWLIGCGVVAIPLKRFVAVDLMALCVHLATWSGLGWWLSHDLSRLEFSAGVGKVAALWLAVGLVAIIGVVITWRTRLVWQPVGARVIRRAGRSFRPDL